MSQRCRRSTSPTHILLSLRSIFGFNFILLMDPVKVCYRKYFLHQKFYQTPKTKYIVYSPRKLMCTPSKWSISSFFTFSSHLGKSVKSSAVLKLFSNISFRWYQEMSNIKTCKNICFVEMNNNLSCLKKALESSLPLI